jgi:hypothetical protein
MSNNSKTITIVVVIIVLIVVGWLFFKGQESVDQTASVNGPNMATNTGLHNQSSSQNGTTASSSVSSDNSDQSLDHDMASIDAEMNGLNSDTARADQAE